MRKMLILLIMAMVLLAGCGKDPQPADGGNSSARTGSGGDTNPTATPAANSDPVIDPDNACYDIFTGSEVWGATYALFHNSDGQLMLFDVASGLCLPYCFDASCPHTAQGYKSPNGGSVSCISYDLSSVTFSLRDDGSYFYDWYRGSLYHADREGRNRREVVHVTDPVTTATQILACYYTKDDLFFTYSRNYEAIPVQGSDGSNTGEWIMGDPLEKNEAGIYRINLKDGTTSYVYQISEYDCLTSNMHVENGHIFFASTWLDVPFDTLPDGFVEPEAYQTALAEHLHTGICDYDLTTGELHQIDTLTGTLADAYFGNGFYVIRHDYADTPAELYRTSGEKIRDLNFNISLCPSMNSDRYLYYQDYDGKSYTYGMYDIVEGTVLKKVSFDEEFAPGPWAAIVGDACYFYGRHLYYINAEDLWNGDLSKLVVLR